MGFSKGVFGGSAARARWRLLRTMLSMWILISSFSIVFHRTLDTPLWLLPQLYFVLLLVFHGWHWAAHQRWLCYPMWKVHMYHHWKVYPPKRFLSREYQNDKPGRTRLGSVAHDGPLYFGIVGNVAMLHALGLVDPVGVAVCVATYAFVGSFANWLHHTFHIEGHWIERYVYFHDLRALHYTHHQGTAKHNYGFLDFTGDLASGVLQQPDYALSNAAAAAPVAETGKAATDRAAGVDGKGKGRRSKSPAAATSGGAGARPAAEAHPFGRGDEHRSKVTPGPLPVLGNDSLQVGTCFSGGACTHMHTHAHSHARARMHCLHVETVALVVST
jgi:hypothetical protein